LGLCPPIHGFIDDACLTHLTGLQRQRLLLRLVYDIHAVSIRLAGRIWGVVRRSFAPYRASTSRTQKVVYLPSNLSHIMSSPSSRLSITYTT
jgi:hypothetical protein